MTEDFKKIEVKILNFWKESKIFQKSLEQRVKAKPFVFFEGPPTANNIPHVGHFLTRIYKDLYGRYKTMRGFYVLRRAGWDTHGLPVEIEVEKQLGLKNKKDIETYGIAKFNKKARENVLKYKSEWEKMSERMGFWIDMDNPYITFKLNYIESVWSIIRRLSEKKLLYLGHKVVPYCPRCGTSLSSHEVAQGYKDITETSVYVKFKIKKQGSIFDKSYLLAWTTTPWTLPGNVALAIGEKITYVEAEKNGERLILARDLAKVLGEGVKIIREFPGLELIGLTYEPLFDIHALKSKTSYRVYPANFVTTQDGTGIVHTAVMYGEDDYELGKKVDLPIHHTVDHEGRFTNDVAGFIGQYVKESERGIISYLKTKNLVLKEEPHLHSYPFCWRCDTQLIYYAKNSWFIRMSSLRKQLIKNNSQINWIPSHLKEGRFGEFIKEAKDWALSRERYWGTPLPIWKCTDCENDLVVGSLADLEKNRYRPRNTYYIIRHGQSTKNTTPEGAVIASRLESDKYDLTQKGIEDIKKIGRKLKKDGGVDLILTSPFLRTRRTSQIISDYVGIKPKIDKRLKEIDHGALCEGLVEPVCLPPEMPIGFDTKRGEGESWRDVKMRIASLIKDLEQKYEGKKILLVSHGDPIFMFQSLTTNLSEPEIITRHEKYFPKEGELKKVFLKNFPRNDDGNIDLHRPYIDDILLICPKCKNKMRRIPELADVWFDSGSMPYAQWHYPFENKNLIDRGTQFPADFIVEAIDQTRGWFYTLLAISTALGKGAPYKNVAVLGHVLDENGQKMSKSKGNVTSPDEIMDKVGVDAARWYFYTFSNLGDSKICSFKDLETKLHGFIGTIQNTLRFLELYTPEIIATGTPKPQTVLDQWLYEKFNNLIGEVTEKLDKYDPTMAGRKIEEFVVNDLSNWWVRRSRRHFQKPANKDELIYVASVLRYILLDLAKILAPFTPFLAEHIHMELHKKVKPGMASIHLHEWPSINVKLKNQNVKLEEEMHETRNLAALGLAQRKNKQLKVRQPLTSVTLKRKEKFNEELEELIKDELNVKQISYNSEQAEEVILDEHLTEELIREGYAREVVRQIQDMRKEVKYKLDEKVFGAWQSDSPDIVVVMEKFGKEIAEDTLLEKFDRGHQDKATYDIEKEFILANKVKIWLGIKR